MRSAKVCSHYTYVYIYVCVCSGFSFERVSGRKKIKIDLAARRAAKGAEKEGTAAFICAHASNLLNFQRPQATRAMLDFSYSFRKCTAYAVVSSRIILAFISFDQKSETKTCWAGLSEMPLIAELLKYLCSCFFLPKI